MALIIPSLPLHDQIHEIRAVKVPPSVRDYYDGDQPPVASPEQIATLGDRASRAYVENVLRKCVNALASRILFDRFVCDDPDVQAALDEFAAKNQYKAMVITNTVRSLVDGNNAVSLSWNGDRVVAHQEDWWDGREGMYVERAADGTVEWAVKEWTSRDKVKRRTVYFPDRIERYALDDTSWMPFPDEASYITPWVKRDAEQTPLGVPVVHFRNTVTSDSLYGASTIEPLLGLQDALNGMLFDIVAASAMNAFGVYTATGIDVKKTQIGVGPGRLWAVESPEARFGVLSGSNLDGIMDGYRSLKSAIAGQFPVSEHLIGGSEWPSGLALQKVEAPMVGHAKLLGDTFAPSHVQLAHRQIEMRNAFDLTSSLDETSLIQIVYDAPEQLDEGTMVEIDKVRIETYEKLAKLPKTLLVKSGLVTEEEALAIVRER